MECTLNPQSLIHKQRVVSSFAPTLTLTNVQCGRHPRSQSLEQRVEGTQTISPTLSRTQNGCYTHSLTSHTHSDSHLSACSPSHTNNGGLILSNLPQPLTRKKRAHPRLTVTLTHRLKGALLSLSPLTRTEWRGLDSSTTTLALTFKHTMGNSFSLRLTHAQSLTQRGGHTPSPSHSNTESSTY